MAAESLLVRQGKASGVTVSVVRVMDRRLGASSQSREWTFQREVEAALYGNGFAEQTGAVYRLLKRSGVQAHTLPLKKACIQQGVVTQAEFDWLRGYLGDVRSFTLIPLDALRSALSVFGREERSLALVTALGLTVPDDWQKEEDEDEDDEEEDSEQKEDDDEDDGGGDEDEDNDDASVAATEVMDEQRGEEDFCSDVEPEEAEAPPPGTAAQHAASERKKVKVTKFEVSANLARQLDALDAHRAVALNVERSSGCVVSATRESDRVRILRFIQWMNETLTFKSPPTLTIFAHSRIGPVAHQYIKELVETHERKYSYAAKMAASFVIAAKFVASRRTTTTATATDDTPVTQLAVLHRQCRQQARQHDQFDVVGKAEFLDWEAVQRVRVAAERVLGSVKTKASKLKLTRDVTILRLLADQPPDRVGVVRTLRLSGSLKRKPDGSYELDLSEPGAHKTSAVFGATRTSINASISPWLDRYIAAADIPADGFLFHARGDKRTAIAPSAWSKCVKATFARHGDVALCPKDARASFITFLRSGDHDDATVKAAAIAMRHSSKIQASATYDKGGSDRRVSAAMKVAADYSAKFSCGGAASSSADAQ